VDLVVLELQAYPVALGQEVVVVAVVVVAAAVVTLVEVEAAVQM